jgi:hypothetical protein
MRPSMDQVVSFIFSKNVSCRLENTRGSIILFIFVEHNNNTAFDLSTARSKDVFYK